MAVRESKIHSRLWCNVQLIGRNVIAHIVAAVVREPQLLRQRIPVESDAVADSPGEYFEAAAIGFHARDRRVWIRTPADIAGCADVGIEHSVGAKRDELPAMLPVCRKAGVNELWFRRVLQPC